MKKIFPPLALTGSLLILFCVWGVVQDFHVNGHPLGFPLDDSWIHMSFGRNLAYHLGFGVQAGSPSTASTSFLYSLWVGFLHWIFGSLGLRAVISAVKISGCLFSLIALGGACRILGLFLRDLPTRLIGSLIVFSAYPLFWASLSGMEIPLNLALCTWAAYFQVLAAQDSSFSDAGVDTTKVPWMARFLVSHCSLQAAFFLWGLAAITRPENGLFLVMAILLFRPQVRFTWIVLGTLPWFCQGAFYGFISGNPLPSTLQAKMTVRALPLLIQAGDGSKILSTLWTSPIQDLGDVFQFLAETNPLFIILFFLPILAFLGKLPGFQEWENRKVRFCFLEFWLCLPLTAILVGLFAGPEHYTLFHGRYLSQTLFLSSIFIACFSMSLWENTPRPGANAGGNPIQTHALPDGNALQKDSIPTMGCVPPKSHGSAKEAPSGRFADTTPSMAGGWRMCLGAIHETLRVLAIHGRHTPSSGYLNKPLWVLAPLLFGFILAGSRHIDLVDRYALENQNINQLQVFLGRWVNAAFPPDTRIAVNDIGAMSYFSRQKLIDLEGLITPETLPFRRAGHIDNFLEQARPDLLCIFPYWYPEILQRPEIFRPVLKLTIEKNLTGGGEEMVFFTMPWTAARIPKIPPLGAIPPSQKGGTLFTTLSPQWPVAVPVPSSAE